MTKASSNQSSGSGAIRDGYEFDTEALRNWMKENIDGFSGDLAVEQFKGGQSNPTYKLITPDKNYVLRRKPPGPILKGAHAVDREARIQSALGQTGFPVAAIYGLCMDDSVLGSDFYVMDLVEGRIFWDTSFPDVSEETRPAYFDAMNATMAQLHKVDYQSLGLGDYGRAGNFFERQIGRWSKQYLADELAGRNAHMDQVLEWLPKNIPDGEETSIIHGDFRCDNMIFHPTEPKVIAVLDWELSTLGNPVSDFAYHAMMYHMPSDIVAGLDQVDLAAMSIPSEADYVKSYCDRTGRTGVANWEFYIAFNFFRLAAIFHGIKGRALRGTAASAHAQERAKDFPRLAELAFDAMQRAKA